MMTRIGPTEDSFLSFPQPYMMIYIRFYHQIYGEKGGGATAALLESKRGESSGKIATQVSSSSAAAHCHPNVQNLSLLTESFACRFTTVHLPH